MKLALEPFSQAIDDIKPLIESHYKEAEIHKDKVALNLDYELLDRLDNLGHLFVFTMRDEGELIAYSVFTVSKSPFYKDYDYAVSLAVYICPEKRHTENTTNFFNFCEGFLTEVGVSVIHYQMRTHKTFSTLMHTLGYENTESIYTKYVGQ